MPRGLVPQLHHGEAEERSTGGHGTWGHGMRGHPRVVGGPVVALPHKPVRYTEYLHGPLEHDAWNRALGDPRVLPWLFARDA